MPESYDIVLSSPFPNYHFFAHKMGELCGQMNLGFFLVKRYVGERVPPEARGPGNSGSGAAGPDR